MAVGEFMAEQSPADEELRVAMFRAMEQMFLHSEASTRFIAAMHARLEGAMAIAAVVDTNEANVRTDRQLAAQKELISHLFDKSLQYVTVIIAGAFAAYFTTLGALTSRFSDMELLLSALLMTVSLTIFVMWQVFNIFYIGHHTFKGDYGLLNEVPRWLKRTWYLMIALTLGTALPAIALSVWVYLRGLGAAEMLLHLQHVITR